MEQKMSYFWWIHKAHVSQQYADNLRANPHNWFRYYFERIICVIFLFSIVIAGLYAAVALLSNIMTHT